MLIVDFVANSELSEVFVELVDLFAEVLGTVFEQTTQVEGVVYFALLSLRGLARKHDLEGLCAFVNRGFGDEGDVLFGYFPTCGIVQQKDLFLACVQFAFESEVLLLILFCLFE